MKVSVLIPAYNEEEGLPKVIEEIPDVVDEIIVVDDGSTDRTFEVAKNFNVKVCRHETNRGKTAAIYTGVENATGDIIVLTDADYTYPGSAIVELVEEVGNGADLVIGSRFMKNPKNVPRFNSIGNRIFSFLAAYISGEYITDSQSGLRAFKKDLLEKLRIKAKGLEFETEMTAKVAKLGYKIVEVPIEYRERVGESKLRPVTDGFRMFLSLLKTCYTETSILARLVLIPSVIFFVLGLTFGVLTLNEYLLFGTIVHIYYPLLTVFLTLLSVQLFSMGLITDNMTKKLRRIEEKVERKKG